MTKETDVSEMTLFSASVDVYLNRPIRVSGLILRVCAVRFTV